MQTSRRAKVTTRSRSAATRKYSHSAQLGKACSKEDSAQPKIINKLYIKKYINNKYWRSMEKREPSYTIGGNVNWYSHYGEPYGGYSKN